MSGISFLKTEDLENIVSFYEKKIGMEEWLVQCGCTILKHGNMLLGFCQAPISDTEGTLTFFYPEKEYVDRMYERFKDTADKPPSINERYNIYNFFAMDPEGRTLEFQTFLHGLFPYLDGEELLVGRRSVRNYRDKNVSQEVLDEVFEVCRYSPTSMNSQSYYFKIVEDPDAKAELASLRGTSSAPIEKAPLAVAICVDPEGTKRPVQDGCIVAYHFMLTAWLHGLGTCWIADMDRERVKDILDIDKSHYVATVTPLGHPEGIPETPEKKPPTVL
ncbi:MAG: nitroreductase family protein [Thermoplasmata archaeon]